MAPAAPAWADWGDKTVAGRLSLVGTNQVGLSLGAELGLGSAWAGFAEVMGELCHDAPLGRMWAGGSWLYDVIAWVPYATVAAGVQWQKQALAPCATAKVGVRYFVAPQLYLGLGVGGLWSPDRLRPELGLQLGWQPTSW